MIGKQRHLMHYTEFLVKGVDVLKRHLHGSFIQILEPEEYAG